MATRRVLLSVGRRLLGGDSAVALEGVGGLTSVHTREMSSRGGRGRFRGAKRPVGKAAPPPTMEDTWEEVKDETTGQTYWWNVQTNETTALGAPKPVATSLTPAQQGGAPPPAAAASGAPPAPAAAAAEPATGSTDALVQQVLRRGGCPFRCLGLERGTSQEGVRKRYLALALRLHPDKAQHPQADEAFAALEGAYSRARDAAAADAAAS